MKHVSHEMYAKDQFRIRSVASGPPTEGSTEVASRTHEERKLTLDRIDLHKLISKAKVFNLEGLPRGMLTSGHLNALMCWYQESSRFTRCTHCLGTFSFECSFLIFVPVICVSVNIPINEWDLNRISCSGIKCI